MGRPRIHETSTVCPLCGDYKYKYAEMCHPCYLATRWVSPTQGRQHSPETRAKISEKASRPKPERRGSLHPMWKGDAADDRLGRDRARRWHEKPDVCERCGKVKRLDWHHIDANPLNNVRENLMALCRKCHQDVDGRTQFFESGRFARGFRMSEQPLSTEGEQP